MVSNLARLLSVAFLVGLCGCGGSSKGATVSGKVSHAGKPVTGGKIMFFPLSGTGESAAGTISADGTYEVKGVPAGDCKITIDTEYLKPTMGNTAKLPAGMQAPPSSAQMDGLTYVKIDPKYGSVDATDLKVTVTGNMTHDIDLK
jgi:hypothetical protein